MSHSKRQHSLVLTPVVWRDQLRHELVGCGLEYDVADLVTRRVIERLVCSYLSGDLDVAPGTTAYEEDAA